MSKEQFASIIIAKLSGSISQDGTGYNSGTASQANIAIADGITEYITSKVKISVAYSGITPPSTPDICSDLLSVTGKCGPPSGNTFASWVKSIETQIMSGFYVGPNLVTPISPTLAFTIPGLIISQGDLKAAHEGNMNSPQQPVWEVICDGIIKWLENIATIKTFPAKHISSTGVATWTKTIVQ